MAVSYLWVCRVHLGNCELNVSSLRCSGFWQPNHKRVWCSERHILSHAL